MLEVMSSFFSLLKCWVCGNISCHISHTPRRVTSGKSLRRSTEELSVVFLTCISGTGRFFQILDHFLPKPDSGNMKHLGNRMWPFKVLSELLC